MYSEIDHLHSFLHIDMAANCWSTDQVRAWREKRNADEVQRSHEMKEVMCQTSDQMICRPAELLSLDWNTLVWEIIKPDLIQEQLLCTSWVWCEEIGAFYTCIYTLCKNLHHHSKHFGVTLYLMCGQQEAWAAAVQALKVNDVHMTKKIDHSNIHEIMWVFPYMCTVLLVNI